MKVAKCKGQAFALNPGHWQPIEDEVKTKSQTVQVSAPVAGQAEGRQAEGRQAAGQNPAVDAQKVQIFDTDPSADAQDEPPTILVPSLEHSPPVASDAKAEPHTGGRK